MAKLNAIMSDLLKEAEITVALLGALMVLCHQASAAPFNIADGDVDALKAAIVSANANAEDDTIDLALNGTYALDTVNNFTNGPTGLPVISADSGHKLVINGRGAVIENSIGLSFRILQIGPGADVTLADLTIARGIAIEPPGFGGGILNDHGTLNVTNCTVRQNVATFGGGICNSGGSGGNATLSVTNSTFNQNSATSFGGGIHNSGSSGGNAMLSVTNSTFRENSFDRFGGIFNDGGFGGSATLSVTNSTFFFNSSGGAIVNGGDLGNATLSVTNSTFSGGTCIANGSILGGNFPVQIGNTILQSVSPERPSIAQNSFGIVTSLGYNLSNDDGGGFLTASGDQINTDPILDPNGLQANGGPTDTIALPLGSPAIDKGKDIGGTGHDQRGSARPFDLAGIPNATGGDGSDIGAFEVQDTDGDGVPDNVDTFPNSDVRPTVFVGTCNTMVPNHVFTNGFTMADHIADLAAKSKNHGAFVSGVASLTNDWKRQGIITIAQKGAIDSCAGKAKLP
jgi:hypothetical protein